MIYKKEIKLALRTTFILLETLILLAGLGIMMMIIFLYMRMSEFIDISLKAIIPAMSACIFSLANSILGYSCILSRRKIRIFLFYLSLAALLNIQIILVLSSNRLAENSSGWLSSSWSRLTDPQRSFIQRRFRCCGLETITDRTGTSCDYNTACMDQFVPILKALRDRCQQLLIILFFIETLSFCVLSLLKFGR